MICFKGDFIAFLVSQGKVALFCFSDEVLTNHSAGKTFLWEEVTKRFSSWFPLLAALPSMASQVCWHADEPEASHRQTPPAVPRGLCRSQKATRSTFHPTDPHHATDSYSQHVERHTTASQRLLYS